MNTLVDQVTDTIEITRTQVPPLPADAQNDALHELTELELVRVGGGIGCSSWR